MFGYALELAWRGLRRYPRITLLSVLALALGMGATITAETVTRLLAGDPLPNRSESLYVVRLDARSQSEIDASRARTRDVPDQLTWLDVKQIEAAQPKVLQSAVVNITPDVKGPAGAETKSNTPTGLEVQSAFFRMFDVPLVAGHAWSATDDANAAPVAVISEKLARKVFGTVHAVGKSLHVDGKLFRIVGISGHWRPYPHFYGLSYCTYSCDAESIFVPVSAARAQGVSLASFSIGGGCNSSTAPNAAKCPYLGFWALLPSAAQRTAYRALLANYADTQHAAGRFARGGTAATRLQTISEYLNSYHVVPVTVKFGFWVALVFLLVCLANVAGLLLTRFLRNSTELGIRRALGATRGAIFTQCLLEAGLIGLAGGLLALPLVWLGLWLVKQQPVAYAGVIGMDWSACVALLVLSIVASLAVGVVPAWRAAVIPPGLQIKEV